MQTTLSKAAKVLHILAVMSLHIKMPLVQVKRKAQREELMSPEGQAAARLSKRLVTLQTDLELPPVR